MKRGKGRKGWLQKIAAARAIVERIAARRGSEASPRKSFSPERANALEEPDHEAPRSESERLWSKGRWYENVDGTWVPISPDRLVLESQSKKRPRA